MKRIVLGLVFCSVLAIARAEEFAYVVATKDLPISVVRGLLPYNAATSYDLSVLDEENLRKVLATRDSLLTIFTSDSPEDLALVEGLTRAGVIRIANPDEVQVSALTCALSTIEYVRTLSK